MLAPNNIWLQTTKTSRTRLEEAKGALFSALFKSKTSVVPIRTDVKYKNPSCEKHIIDAGAKGSHRRKAEK